MVNSPHSYRKHNGGILNLLSYSSSMKTEDLKIICEDLILSIYYLESELSA